MKIFHKSNNDIINSLCFFYYKVSESFNKKVQFRGIKKDLFFSKYHIKNVPVVWDKYPWKPKL